VSLVAEIAAVLAAHGASNALAVQAANDFSAKLLPLIEHETREKKVADLFYKKPRAKLAEELHVHRSTVYRMHAKLSRNPVALATVAA
jgi:DNA-directed RNA polymerase specialized sigma subunit